MKVSSNPQLFQTISAFADAKRVQEQALQERRPDQQQKTDKQVEARELLKQDLIRQNRDAVQKTQETLRQQRIEELRASQQSEEVASNTVSQNVNLNLRESPDVGSQSPAFVKLGQIVDIRI
ncbi:MAG: hypothetical protein CMF31_04790 [Kordiimonas sp.]|nr:hypothetical protein [Kordiimonas sp.]|tara:strand:+ start:3461 stop:3826 length:366 start_codon:yes stop_codon:yes gene_type:complete